MNPDRGEPFFFASRILGRRVVDAAGGRLGRVVDLVAATQEWALSSGFLSILAR